jgi:pseudolysin
MSIKQGEAMKKGMVSVLAMAAACNSNAASQELLWGEPTKILPTFQTPFQPQGLTTVIRSQQKDYQLALISKNAKHPRYQLLYKDIPIWGHQIIFHKKQGLKSFVTGINANKIEADVNSVDAQLSMKDVEEPILARVTEPIKFKHNEKIIYIDGEEKAHLAYHLSYYVLNSKAGVQSPNYIVDANSGDVLKQWDNAHSEQIGQGLGGNAFPLPYRSGMFQHGNALPNLPALGKFDVQVANGVCYVENNALRVISLKNYPLGYGAFPITPEEEETYHLNAFAYPCDALTNYINFTDGSTAPINYSFSPINDTMYFADKTLKMYQEWYGINYPIGTDLPIRAYTHLGAMDNAFAIPTIRENGEIVAHQQIVIGNGQFFLTAPAQSVVGHELSHNFTDVNSGLIYDGQSGGINESFSDMAAIALEDYISHDYPWYWDGTDWSIGREAMVSGKPLRYMDNPKEDGESIDNAKDYNDNLNVHYSSGVFNKAFYLLATKPGWSVQKAFQLMVDANQNYWSPLAYFDFAACGVIQAAIDRRLDESAVIEAFAEVGVTCPTKSNTLA